MTATVALTERVRSLLVALPLVLLLFAGEARAEGGFGGFIEYNFNSSDLRSTDPTGVTARSTSEFFQQRYNLSLGRDLYPNLSLATGLIFEHDLNHSTSSDIATSGSTTQFSPTASLTLTNPILPTSVGYSRREERSTTNGVSQPASILDSYTARTTLNYAKLPPISLSYAYFESYDENKTSHDLVSQTLLWSTALQPLDRLSLGYQGGWTQSDNLLTNLTSDTFNHTGRVGWSDTLLKNRVSYSTSYSLSTLTTTVSSSGSGVLYTAQTPNTGLSATSSLATIPPITATTGQLSPNAALASGGANINLVSATTPPAGTIIQMGLDFGFGAPVAANTLYLTIISGTNQRPENLSQIATIAQLFSWDVYISADGVNWNLEQAGVNQQFGNDPTGLSDTLGFTLTLPGTVTSRFVKVVVTPVSSDLLLPYASIPNIDIHSIAVSRLQAYSRKSGSALPKSAVTSVAGQLSLNASARLLENPGLNYDFGFGFTHSSVTGQALTTSWYMNNGLGFEKQLTPIVNSNAHVSLLQQGGGGAGGVQSSVSYNTALSIAPLPTLTDSLSYSGSIATGTTSNAIYLSNTAQLYQGVSLAISGGYSSTTSSSGVKSDSASLSSGLSVAPRRDFSFNVSYSESVTKSSGGTVPASDTSQRAGSVTANYTPFPALYVSGSFSAAAGTGQPFNTAESFSASWAPFRGGALTLNISYSESLTTPDNVKTRTVSPTVRWKVSPRINVDLNYQYFRTDSPAAGVSEGSSVGATLRLII